MDTLLKKCYNYKWERGYIYGGKQDIGAYLCIMISIKLDMNRIPPEAFEALREKHHIWYKTYFDAGKFLMFGTRPDNSGESLIIAQGTAEDLEEAVQFDHICGAIGNL